MIVDGEGEFHQNILTLGNNFKIEYEQLLEVYNGSHCRMDLIKNVTTTTKGDRYLRAQHYILLTKVMDEATQAHLLQLHNKLSNVQSTFKEEISYTFLCIICFFQIYTIKIKQNLMFISWTIMKFLFFFLTLDLGLFFKRRKLGWAPKFPYYLCRKKNQNKKMFKPRLWKTTRSFFFSSLGDLMVIKSFHIKLGRTILWPLNQDFFFPSWRLVCH